MIRSVHAFNRGIRMIVTSAWPAPLDAGTRAIVSAAYTGITRPP